MTIIGQESDRSTRWIR